ARMNAGTSFFEGSNRRGLLPHSHLMFKGLFFAFRMTLGRKAGGHVDSNTAQRLGVPLTTLLQVEKTDAKFLSRVK
ncbi:hypothetical protein M407DRAFT_246789, partial [Tulasnella calospora MUT 4182]